MLKTQFFIAAALLAGVAIGYFARTPNGSPEAADDAYEAKKSVSDKGEAASLKALRRRIAELERQLAERSEESELLVSNEVAALQRPAWGNPREWMENLKKTDPVAYARMTNHWAHMRSAHAERTREKLEFLSSIDVSRMGERAQEVHQTLLDAIVRHAELFDEINQADLSDDQRRKVAEELGEASHEVRRLNRQERNNLIMEAARKSGVKGPMAKELSATIRDVIEATEGGWGGPHRGPPPGGRPGGAGGR